MSQQKQDNVTCYSRYLYSIATCCVPEWFIATSSSLSGLKSNIYEVLSINDDCDGNDVNVYTVGPTGLFIVMSLKFKITSSQKCAIEKLLAYVFGKCVTWKWTLSCFTCEVEEEDECCPTPPPCGENAKNVKNAKKHNHHH